MTGLYLLPILNSKEIHKSFYDVVCVLQEVDKVKVEFSHQELFDFYEKVCCGKKYISLFYT